MRYTLSQPGDPRSTLVVDTLDRFEDDALVAIRTFMFENRCANGLLFTPDECLLLRDTYADMSPDSVEVAARIPTEALLRTLGAHNHGSLGVRVGRWLTLLSSSWNAAVPTDCEPARELVYDVAPAATGATIHPWSAAA